MIRELPVLAILCVMNFAAPAAAQLTHADPEAGTGAPTGADQCHNCTYVVHKWEQPIYRPVIGITNEWVDRPSTDAYCSVWLTALPDGSTADPCVVCVAIAGGVVVSGPNQGAAEVFQMQLTRDVSRWRYMPDRGTRRSVINVEYFDSSDDDARNDRGDVRIFDNNICSARAITAGSP